MEKQTTDTQCCPPFDPSLWDDKIFEWDNKRFIKTKVFSIFYIPVSFGAVMKKIYSKLTGIGANILDCMWLSDYTSKWNMDLYLAVDKDVPGEENITLSGKFLSKVYEGNFKKTEKWCRDFQSFAKSKNLNLKKMYMWYTTCPKCAKKYGKNYVAIIAQVE